MSSSVEHVGVIPRDLANQLGLLGHGFTPLADNEVLGRIGSALSFLERPRAEDDPSHKQIIPYGLVRRGDDVLLLRRLTGGGEERLHGKLSLGVGGHVNPIDLDGSTDLIGETMRRELDEELYIDGLVELRPRGFINDDETPVGQVHLGVVYEIVLAPNGTASVRETDCLAGDFESWSDVATKRERMETWSAFLIDAFRNGHVG